MSAFKIRIALPLLAAAALAPLASAQAAPACPTSGASALTMGTVTDVPAGSGRTYTITLAAGEGVIVDLANLNAKPKPASSDGEDEEGEDETKTPPAHAVRICNSAGALLAPQPGEVFEKGGSVTSTPDGERLRFVAPSAGSYVISVASSDDAREILARHRDLGAAQSPIVSAGLDTIQKGRVSSTAPMIFTFAGTAGQWVELKSTSDKDTVLRLAGPDRKGAYAQIAENDDSDGLNPLIRRRLPVTGIYYLQVDSLAEDMGDFELTLKKIDMPKPPPPPTAMRVGARIADKLKDGDDVRLYSLPVTAGHNYRLLLNAAYDGVVAIGLNNPIEPDDGSDKADAGFSEVKSQDSGTTGDEKLDFTARSTGTLLVRVKSFGIGETDGSYTLIATDEGN
ncbi:MAG: hypothetical protein AB7F98_02730 [Novosphingobium sp.]